MIKYDPIIRRKTLVPALVIALSLSSCASFWSLQTANRLLKEGDRPGAVTAACRALTEDPSNKEAADIVSVHFLKATEECLADADAATASLDPFRYDLAVKAYRALAAMNDGLESALPKANPETRARLNFVVTRKDDELRTALDKAAEAHIQAGNALMASGGKKNARSAYGHFVIALDFGPRREDARAAANESLRLGTDTLAAMQADNPIGIFRYWESDGILTEKIRELLPNGAKRKTFVKITELTASPDYILSVRVVDFDISTEITDVKRKEASKIIVPADPAKGVKEVSAHAELVSYTSKTTLSVGTTWHILDTASGAIVKSGNVREYVADSANIFEYSGDKRALSQADLDLYGQGKYRPPDRDALFKKVLPGLAETICLQALAVFE